MFAGLRCHRHAVAHLVAITLGLLAVLGILFGVGVGGRVKHDAKPVARQTLKTVAVQAARQAADTPNPACQPAMGTGYMGACAPTQAYGLADDLAVLAGDPDTITTPIGIDVSNNNGTIDWPTLLKAHPNVKFVFAKASESTTYTDTQLAHNLAGLKTAKAPYGVYDFVRCGYSTATAEADHFVAVIKTYGANTSLPPVADVEVNDGCSAAQMRAYVATWVSVVKTGLDRTPIIYTDEGFWSGGVGGSNNGTGLWAADWATSPILASSWTSWEFWQYSSSGIGPSPQIGSWDMDTFNGTEAQLQKLAQVPVPPKPKPPAPKPKPKPVPVPKGTVCFGRHGTPTSSACEPIVKHWEWLVSRRDFWQHQFNRCIRYADGIGCGHANRWFHVRGSEAAKLRKRYS